MIYGNSKHMRSMLLFLSLEVKFIFIILKTILYIILYRKNYML